MSTKKIIRQKAGDDSRLTSIGTLAVINNQPGLTIEEVKGIVQNEATKILSEANKAAKQIADERVNSFSNTLIDKLILSNHLESFRDPTTFLLLKSAQEAAMYTDDKTDHEILSELLLHKMEHPNDKNISAVTKKAISEIGNISNDALNALTIFFAAGAISPTLPQIKEGIKLIDTLFSNLLETIEPPNNYDWIENLDAIGAIRLSSFGTTKKYMTLVQEKFSGYFVLGIKKKSDEYTESLNLLKSSNISTNILIDNELHQNYVRLALPSLKKINRVKWIDDDNKQQVTLSNIQLDALNKIIDLYVKNGEDYEVMKQRFSELLLKHKHISLIKDWWDKLTELNISFRITPMGETLAHTNIKRIYPKLPDINKNWD